jgi:hypothetical protein
MMNAAANDDRNTRRKPFLGIMFECCSIYSRIYKNKEGTAYVGHCPKCAKRLVVRIGPGGTDHRFFRAR